MSRTLMTCSGYCVMGECSCGELPGLQENIERLIEEELERQRPLAGQDDTRYLICKECNLWSNEPNVRFLCDHTGAASGYDQILAQIKEEANEVKL